MDGFIACFEGLEDPRTGNAGRHNLLEILMIALCTVLCGGQSAMAEFAEDKEAFLRSFLTLEHGPPSHDTFSRVCSIPTNSAPAFSASWRGSPKPPRASSRSTVRAPAKISAQISAAEAPV